MGELTVILGSISASGDDLINTRNKNGYNMLHYAVAYGQINAVKLLLEHGAGTYIVVAKFKYNNYLKITSYIPIT